MIELARLAPGDFFGEIALLADTSRSASVRADSRVRVLEISRPGFKRLLSENLDIAFAVMQELSKRLGDTDQKMIEGLLRKNEELQLAHRRLEQSYDTTLLTLSNALDLRDTATEGHSVRVASIAIQIGRAMALAERQLEALRRGGLLHDVGPTARPVHPKKPWPPSAKKRGASLIRLSSPHLKGSCQPSARGHEQRRPCT